MARQAAGFTCRELAEKLKVDEDYISQLENAYNNPSIPVLAQICRETGTSADFILAGFKTDELASAEHVLLDVLSALTISDLKLIGKLPEKVRRAFLLLAEGH